MYILGSIIKLEDNAVDIPIPWWHRAPLGLESSTRVYVSVTEAKENRPGDLLLSVLDTVRWDQNVHVYCVREDAPGVIEQALSIVKDWNIALAETITLEGGKRHRVELILEPPTDLQTTDVKAAVGELRRSIEAKFKPARVIRFQPNEAKISWNRLGQIRNGWATFNRRPGRETWRDVIEKQMSALGIADKFDPNRLVISGHTDGRLFRAMIPRKGTLLVTVEHADRPGTLLKLTTAFKQAGVNVLSSLLKRGGAAPGNAILVAVCEPTGNMTREELTERIAGHFNNLPVELRVELEFGDGMTAEEVIYSQHTDHVVARVPPSLRARVMELRRKLPKDAFPVFISRRFLMGNLADRYAAKIRDVLTSLECPIIEAEVQPGSGTGPMTEVSAAMWAAKAGIVLAVEPTEAQAIGFSLNLAHEFGFMQGQGKPLLLLVEESRVLKELDDWSNVKGINAPRFTKERAFEDDDPQSIKTAIVRWYNTIRPNADRE